MGLGKEFAKQGWYRLVRNPVGEALLYQGQRLAPAPWADPLFRRLAPQPSNYERGKLRMVERYGLQFQLDPADYFQWHHYYGFRDGVLTVLLELARGKRYILDIGANIGLYASCLAKAEPDAQVVAIEPHPSTYARLERHQSLNNLNNLRPLQRAIGAEPGELELRDPGQGDSGKFTLRPGVDGGKSVKVRVLALPQLLQELGWTQLDLVKIDVEGFEPEVFAGSVGSFLSLRPQLVFELSPNWYGARGEGLLRDLKVLEAAGYRATEVLDEHGQRGPCDLEAAIRRPQKRQYNVVLTPQ